MGGFVGFDGVFCHLIFHGFTLVKVLPFVNWSRIYHTDFTHNCEMFVCRKTASLYGLLICDISFESTVWSYDFKWKRKFVSNVYSGQVSIHPIRMLSLA